MNKFQKSIAKKPHPYKLPLVTTTWVLNPAEIIIAFSQEYDLDQLDLYGPKRPSLRASRVRALISLVLHDGLRMSYRDIAALFDSKFQFKETMDKTKKELALDELLSIRFHFVLNLLLQKNRARLEEMHQDLPTADEITRRYSNLA